MQEEEKKTVDIDTSGPEVDIELPEEKKEEVAEQPTEDKTYENERETKLEDGGSAGDTCLLYTSPSPRDAHESRMPSSA